MSPDRWRQISRLLHDALVCAADEPDTFLHKRRADDAAVSPEVESPQTHDCAAEASPGAPLAEVLPRMLPRHPAPSLVGRQLAPETAVPPLWVGGYRLIRQLGEGGMGLVYEAEQQHPRRPVALKLIRGGASVTAQRLKLFEREVQALARLRHPGIAAIYEAGRAPDDQPFFAMELVRGETLDAYAQRLRRTPSVPSREPLLLFLRICDAVSYAHQRGVIHRDLKPQNIMVTRNAGSSHTFTPAPEIKVLDFGLARITDADLAAGTLLTEPGRVQGTLAYMSPEEVRGNPDEIDLRTDIYSLGVILYELVTGSLPYDVAGVPFLDAARIICEHDPKPPSKALQLRGPQPGKPKQLSRDLEAVLLKALEKEPGRRYQSASALAEDVDRVLHDEPVSARPPSITYHVRKIVARHKVPFAFATAFIVLLAVFAAVMAVQSVRLARERDRARVEAETSRRVTDFMVELFNVSDPSESRGNTVTAREVLDRGVARLERDLKNDPPIQARLQHTIGRVYTSLGLYKEAEPLLEAALETRRKQFGDKSLEVAQTLYDLTALAGDATWPQMVDRKAQERWSRESLAIRRERLGNESLDVAASLQQLGVVIAFASDRDGEAEGLLQDSLAIRKRRLGNQHPLVADSLAGLGLVISYVQSDFARGEPFLREALAMRRRFLGNDHPDTLRSIQALANHLNRKGDKAGAVPLYREEIAISKKTLGPMHPRVALQMNDLLLVLGWTGDFEEADRVGREALAIADPKYPDISTRVRTNLAANSRSMDDADSAETLLLQAVSGPTSDRKGGLQLRALIDLASLLNAKSDHDEALRRANEAIAIGRQLGSPSFGLVEALYERGNALLPSDRGQAERAYSEGVEILGPLLATVKRQRSTDPRSVAQREALLGRLLAALGRYDEAEPLLIRSHAYIMDYYGDRHHVTREARERIVRMYDDWGKPEKAAEYRVDHPVVKATLRARSVQRPPDP